MTKVEIRYLQANGRYHEGSGETETHSPIFIVNSHDHQAHSLVHHPAYPVTSEGKLPWFTSWDEVLQAEPPPARHYTDKIRVVCEDENPWPFSCTVLPDPIDRQLEFKEYNSACLQKAVTSSSRDSDRRQMRDFWSVASLTIFCIVSAIIVLIVLQSRTAQSLTSSGLFLPGMAAFLMGGLSFRRKRPKNVDNEEPKSVKRKKPFRKDWEIVTLADEVSLQRGLDPIWELVLPLEAITTGHPSVSVDRNARYTRELSSARWTGAAFWGGIGMALSMILFSLALKLGLWSIPAAAPVIAILGMFGYFVGYKPWAPTPCWTMRRLFRRNQQGQILDINGDVFHPDSMVPAATEIECQPHTMLTGVDYDYYTFRRRSGIEIAAKQIAAQGSRDSGGKQVAAQVDPETLAVHYRPRKFTASTLYEYIVGRDYKRKFRDRPQKLSKLEKMSRAGMALGSIGLLIFVVYFLN